MGIRQTTVRHLISPLNLTPKYWHLLFQYIFFQSVWPLFYFTYPSCFSEDGCLLCENLRQPSILSSAVHCIQGICSFPGKKLGNRNRKRVKTVTQFILSLVWLQEHHVGYNQSTTEVLICHVNCFFLIPLMNYQIRQNYIFLLGLPDTYIRIRKGPQVSSLG